MTTIITPAPAFQKPSGKMYLDAHQLNLVDAASTLVELNHVSNGFADGIESTALHRITPGQAGYYIVKGMVTFMYIVANCNYAAGFRINSVTWHSYNIGWPSGGVVYCVPVGDLVKLTATDYVELWARSYSGDDTVDIYRGLMRTFLSVQRVR